MEQRKVSAQSAGYMELAGAKKDAGCQIVDVKGGVSSRKGCCNLYRPVKDADDFRCGECTFLVKEIAQAQPAVPEAHKGEVQTGKGGIKYRMDVVHVPSTATGKESPTS